MEDADICCERCKFWKGDTDVPSDRWKIYDDDCNLAIPPHANLRWGVCDAAPEGFDEDNYRPDLKMAVWDGSSYAAQLVTRKDHYCGEFRPAGDGGK